MDAAAAPLATVEDLSDPETVTDDEKYSDVASVKFVPTKRPPCRVRSVSEGPVYDVSALDFVRPRQSESVCEALLGRSGNRSDVAERRAKHHMVLVHMKPEKAPCMQSYLVSPVRRSSCLSGESSGIFCRICHEGDGKEDLISPCKCTGTMGLIHVSCIEKWLSQTGTSKCEICGFEYITEKTSRSLTEWLRQPARPTDKRNLYGDLACFVLLTPLAGVSSWLCLSGAVHYSKFEKTKWETAGLVTLAVFLILIYMVWCMVASRYHVRVIKDWRKANQVVRILPRSDHKGATASGDVNNNCSSSPIFSPIANQGGMVHSPRHSTSLRISPTNNPLSASQSSLHSNPSSRFLSSKPLAVSSPTHPPPNDGYPDILQRYVAAAARYPGCHGQSPRSEIPLSGATRSLCSDQVCQSNRYRSTYSPIPQHQKNSSRDFDGLVESKSFTRSLPKPKEHRDMSGRTKYIRVRSSLSESACQGLRSRDDDDAPHVSVMHIVKETYV